MDSLLEERWKSSLPPFDGACLYPDDYLPLVQLRPLMMAMVDSLRADTSSIPLYRFDDWHEHDGYVTERSSIDWDMIGRAIVDDESLYAARHGDAYVYWAYYPEDFTFLFRFLVLDADEDSAYPGIWGKCTLCGPAALIHAVKANAPQSVVARLVVTSAKEYFDKVYAG